MRRTAILLGIIGLCSLVVALMGCDHPTYSGGDQQQNGGVDEGVPVVLRSLWVIEHFWSGEHEGDYPAASRQMLEVMPDGTFVVRNAQGQQVGNGIVTNRDGVVTFTTEEGTPPNGWSATERLDYEETDDGVRITHLDSEVDFDELLVRQDHQY